MVVSRYVSAFYCFMLMLVDFIILVLAQLIRTGLLIKSSMSTTFPHYLPSPSQYMALVAMSEQRPKRTVTASSKLLDPTNTAKHDVTSHWHAIEAKRAADSANQQDTTKTFPSSEDESENGPEAQLSTPGVSSNPPLATGTEDLNSSSPGSSGEDQPITHRKCFILEPPIPPLTFCEL
jgi:hypothetical protein